MKESEWALEFMCASEKPKEKWKEKYLPGAESVRQK